MTEDERHIRAMADLAEQEAEIHKRWAGSTFFTPFLGHELKTLRWQREMEMNRHAVRKSAIRAANPAPGFNYRLC